MRLLLLGVLLLAGIAVGYPLLNENTNDLCNALERRLISVITADQKDPGAVIFLGILQKSFSGGSLVRTLIKQREPNLPPDVACGAAYWRLVLDPAGARALLERLLNTRRTEALPGSRPRSTAAAGQRDAKHAPAVWRQ
jgi:hypothetical protein